MTEDEMAGWHHWLDGCAFEWTLGDGDGQGGLACCNSWGRKELDMTERLNWTELNQSAKFGRIQSIKNNDSNITCWVWKIIQSDTHFLNEGGSKKASSSLQKNASYTCRSNRIRKSSNFAIMNVIADSHKDPQWLLSLSLGERLLGKKTVTES